LEGKKQLKKKKILASLEKPRFSRFGGSWNGTKKKGGRFGSGRRERFWEKKKVLRVQRGANPENVQYKRSKKLRGGEKKGKKGGEVSLLNSEKKKKTFGGKSKHERAKKMPISEDARDRCWG